MLIPVMIFLREIKDFSQMSEKQHAFVKFWYWASIFSERYSGSSNEVVIQDTKILQQIAKNQRISDKNYFQKLKLQVDESGEVLAYNKKGSAVYKGFLNLVNYEARGLPDWRNSSKLSFNHSNLDDHHIFPRDFLKNGYLGIEEDIELGDSVANRTLIPKITNIKIGKKKPSAYLSELKVSNEDIADSLVTHLVPQGTNGFGILEGYYDDKFDQFLLERAELMFGLVKKYVVDVRESIIAEFYADQSIVEENAD